MHKRNSNRATEVTNIQVGLEIQNQQALLPHTPELTVK